MRGTRYEAFKVKQAQDIVVVNNRISGAYTIMYVHAEYVCIRPVMSLVLSLFGWFLVDPGTIGMAAFDDSTTREPP